MACLMAPAAVRVMTPACPGAGTSRVDGERAWGRGCARAALWTRNGPDRPGSALGRVDLRGAELLDVHVLERQHLDVLGEAGRAVHVPHPGVAHRDLEEHVTGLGA